MKGHVARRNGRWYVVLETKREQDAETGEPIRSRVGAGGYATKKEANAVLADALAAARTGWRGPSRKTVAGFLRDEWLPGVRMELAGTTAALYSTICESYVIPHLGTMRLDELTSADLTALYSALLDHGGRGGRSLAPRTVRHVHTTLRRALADAVEARHIAWNPAIGAKAPRVAPSVEPAAWTADQLRAFLAHVADDRLGALWTLAATTGMRRSELLGVRWSDIADGEVHIRQVLVTYGRSLPPTLKEPKTPASRRKIPLEPRAEQALRRWATVQKEERLAAGEVYTSSGLVFTDEIGRLLSPVRVSSLFQAAVRSTGLPAIGLHGLRHTFATIALDAGVDVLYAAEVLGHSSPAITQAIYQHTRPERKREAIGKVGAAIFG